MTKIPSQNNAFTAFLCLQVKKQTGPYLFSFVHHGGDVLGAVPGCGVSCRAVPERVVFVGEGRGPAVPVAWLIDLDLPQSAIYVCGGVTCYILYCVQVVYIFYGWILELCAYDHTFK